MRPRSPGTGLSNGSRSGLEPTRQPADLRSRALTSKTTARNPIGHSSHKQPRLHRESPTAANGAELARRCGPFRVGAGARLLLGRRGQRHRPRKERLRPPREPASVAGRLFGRADAMAPRWTWRELRLPRLQLGPSAGDRAGRLAGLRRGGGVLAHGDEARLQRGDRTAKHPLVDAELPRDVLTVDGGYDSGSRDAAKGGGERREQRVTQVKDRDTATMPHDRDERPEDEDGQPSLATPQRGQALWASITLVQMEGELLHAAARGRILTRDEEHSRRRRVERFRPSL